MQLIKFPRSTKVESFTNGKELFDIAGKYIGSPLSKAIKHSLGYSEEAISYVLEIATYSTSDIAKLNYCAEVLGHTFDVDSDLYYSIEYFNDNHLYIGEEEANIFNYSDYKFYAQISDDNEIKNASFNVSFLLKAIEHLTHFNFKEYLNILSFYNDLIDIEKEMILFALSQTTEAKINSISDFNAFLDFARENFIILKESDLDYFLETNLDKNLRDDYFDTKEYLAVFFAESEYKHMFKCRFNNVILSKG